MVAPMLSSGLPALFKLDQHPRIAQWLALLVLAVLFTVVLEQLRLPAALLLGPMLAAILCVSVGQASIRVGSLPFTLAQGFIGMMIAQSLSPEILAEIRAQWPIIIGSAFFVIVVANGLGYILARQRILPGTTAIWGCSPGAATAQMVMAGLYGGDMRLVAFMQYLRLVLVAGFASGIASVFLGSSDTPKPAPVWFPSLTTWPFAETFVVAVATALIARRLQIPAGPLLMPLIMGALLRNLGLLQISLPPWLLALSFGLVGWTVGLQFTWAIMLHAARAFPKILLSILTLMALCGLYALGLTYIAGVDLLTAYLATSPGGADSIAIIAASSPADMSFVMALQTARFILVVITGPSVSRFVLKRLEREAVHEPMA